MPTIKGNKPSSGRRAAKASPKAPQCPLACKTHKYKPSNTENPAITNANDPAEPDSQRHRSSHGDLHAFGVSAALHFEHAVLETAVGDDHAQRHADEFPIGEHRARALAAIVEHDVDAQGLEFVV